MKTVKYFDTTLEAGTALSLLESEGIQAVMLNENIGSAIPITLANPSMRPYIAVADGDYPRAAELLGVDSIEEKHQCPGCGAQEIKYGIAGKSGRKRAIKLIFVFLSILGGVPLGYCGTCGTEF